MLEHVDTQFGLTESARPCKPPRDLLQPILHQVFDLNQKTDSHSNLLVARKSLL